jgi:2,4-dienoyl-CoA reductase-like NADH-dependent reductase (Old Yellow Enzyme family)
MNKLFESLTLGSLTLKNRIIRSATLEGAADSAGNPSDGMIDMYREIAVGGAAAIVSGFCSVDQQGRAMQPGQLFFHHEAQIPRFRELSEAVREQDCRLILQIAHAGRQTKPNSIGTEPVSWSNRPSNYFQTNPRELTLAEIEEIIEHYAHTAQLAREAGFDGVQIHAAHGYLVHQSLSPRLNQRTDRYSPSPDCGFLKALVEAIRGRCGKDFSLWVKISHSSDHRDFQGIVFEELLSALNAMEIDAIEISYGTMENPLNIFRGKTLPQKEIFAYNPRYEQENAFMRYAANTLAAPILKRKVIPWSAGYNLDAAYQAVAMTDKAIIAVGALHSGEQMAEAVSNGISLIGLCRPLIAEPGFVNRIAKNAKAKTSCIYCNLCAVYCDLPGITRCYRYERNRPKHRIK